MSEPQSTIVQAAGAAGAWFLMGADPSSLLIGTVVATFITFWLGQIDSKVRAAAAIAFSGFASGFVVPWAVKIVALKYPEFYNESLDELLSLAVGMFTPTLVPVLLRRAATKVEEI